MQGFVGGSAIDTGLVAGCATALVQIAAVWRGNQVSRGEQERGGAESAGEGANEGKSHIGMDSITLTPHGSGPCGSALAGLGLTLGGRTLP